MSRRAQRGLRPLTLVELEDDVVNELRLPERLQSARDCRMLKR